MACAPPSPAWLVCDVDWFLCVCLCVCLCGCGCVAVVVAVAVCVAVWCSLQTSGSASHKPPRPKSNTPTLAAGAEASAGDDTNGPKPSFTVMQGNVPDEVGALASPCADTWPVARPDLLPGGAPRQIPDEVGNGEWDDATNGMNDAQSEAERQRRKEERRRRKERHKKKKKKREREERRRAKEAAGEDGGEPSPSDGECRSCACALCLCPVPCALCLGLCLCLCLVPCALCLCLQFHDSHARWRVCMPHSHRFVVCPPPPAGASTSAVDDLSDALSFTGADTAATAPANHRCDAVAGACTVLLRRMCDGSVV